MKLPFLLGAIGGFATLSLAAAWLARDYLMKHRRPVALLTSDSPRKSASGRRRRAASPPPTASAPPGR